jgi:hypothetical protein
VTPRAAVRLAWGLWGLALALIAAALAVNAVHAWSYSGVLAVLSLAFLTVGAFLAGRRPANAVGWLLLGWGVVMAFVTLTSAYVDRATVRDPGSLPGPEWVAWAEATVWHPAFSLLAFLLLLRAVDTHRHRSSPSDTVPLRGASHREGGFGRGRVRVRPGPGGGGGA